MRARSAVASEAGIPVRRDKCALKKFPVSRSSSTISRGGCSSDEARRNKINVAYRIGAIVEAGQGRQQESCKTYILDAIVVRRLSYLAQLGQLGPVTQQSIDELGSLAEGSSPETYCASLDSLIAR